MSAGSVEAMKRADLLPEVEAAGTGRAASGRPPSTIWRAAQAAWRVATTHPVAVPFAVALVVRIIAAVAITTLHHGYLFPDESDYVGYGRLSATGHLTPAIAGGYGEALFHEAASYMWPLTILFKVFGGHTVVAAVWAALFGAVTAALVALLVGRVLSRSWATLAGLVVAVFPSQILWSSVALRESMVWAGLAGAAAGVAMLSRAKSWKGLIAATVLISVSLLTIANLRNWVFVPAAWATALAPWFFRPARPAVARSLCLAMCVLIPLASGIGPAGSSFVRRNGGSLGYERTVLSENAHSAFVPQKVAANPKGSSGKASSGSSSSGTSSSGSSSSGTSSSGSSPTTSNTIPTAIAGENLVVPHGLKNDLRALPRGLVAFLLRPFPWQHGGGLSYDFAAVEELLYYPLYVFAVIGLVAYRRRRDLIAFPVLVAGMIAGVAAEAEGNLGSAFRHRGQLLWVLVLLASLGASWAWDRARDAWQKRQASRARAPQPT